MARLSRRSTLAGASSVVAAVSLPAAGMTRGLRKVEARDGRGPVVVRARPGPFELDPNRTAIIVVDMQNDFGSTGGMFERAGVDISKIKAAVAPTRRVLAAARASAVPVVYLKMAFRPDLSDAGASDSPNWLRHQRLHAGEAVIAPDGRPSRILIRETWNTDILTELTPQKGDEVVYKHRFSGFFETELDDILKHRRVKELIFTGCTTSVCVESTLRDAMFRDYRCLLLEDCTAEPVGDDAPRSNYAASVTVVEALFGWVSDSKEFISSLEQQRAPASA